MRTRPTGTNLVCIPGVPKTASGRPYRVGQRLMTTMVDTAHRAKLQPMPTLDAIGDARRREAIAAAVEVAAQLGLDVSGPVVLKDSNNTIIWLRQLPSPPTHIPPHRPGQPEGWRCNRACSLIWPAPTLRWPISPLAFRPSSMRQPVRASCYLTMSTTTLSAVSLRRQRARCWPRSTQASATIMRTCCPAGFATAVLIADALAWENAPHDLGADFVAEQHHGRELLARAVAYRVATAAHLWDIHEQLRRRSRHYAPLLTN
jgi:hypothetical protein